MSEPIKSTDVNTAEAGNAPSLSAVTTTVPNTAVDSCADTHGEHAQHTVATAKVIQRLRIKTSENQKNKAHQARLGANVR
jgi:hypothetical protein